MQLQGEPGRRFGAIWQVLPQYKRLLKHLETLRQQYPSNLEPHLVLDADGCAKKQTYLTSEAHCAINVNLGWERLDEYYTLLDNTHIYVAAVVLHPHPEWRWFEKKWSSAPQKRWLRDAKAQFALSWEDYKTRPASPSSLPSSPPTSSLPSKATSSGVFDNLSIDDSHLELDQLAQYLAEPRT